MFQPPKNKRTLVRRANPAGAFLAEGGNYCRFQSCDGSSRTGLQRSLVRLTDGQWRRVLTDRLVCPKKKKNVGEGKRRWGLKGAVFIRVGRDPPEGGLECIPMGDGGKKKEKRRVRVISRLSVSESVFNNRYQTIKGHQISQGSSQQQPKQPNIKI